MLPTMFAGRWLEGVPYYFVTNLLRTALSFSSQVNAAARSASIRGVSNGRFTATARFAHMLTLQDGLIVRLKDSVG